MGFIASPVLLLLFIFFISNFLPLVRCFLALKINFKKTTSFLHPQRRVGNVVLFANTDVPLDASWDFTADPVTTGGPLRIDAYLSAAFGYQVGSAGSAAVHCTCVAPHRKERSCTAVSCARL